MTKLALLAVAAVVALAPTRSRAAQVWVAPSAVKIRPGATPTPTAAAALAAAQNEFESFQVVVTGAAAGVSMALESLDDGKGHVISGRDLTLYREALINVTQATGGDGAAGIWPDALVPAVDPIVGEKRNAFPFDVPAGESRAVLVDIHVPETAPAGTYSGTLSVQGGATAQVPVTLEVWDFAIPSTSTLRTSFDMAWNGPCMGHGDGSCSNVTAEQQLRARYIQAALDNRISINRPTYTAPVNGTGSGSWADYDLYAGPFLSGTANTRLRGAKLTSTQIQGTARTTSAGVKAWSDHFKANGWSNVLFNYICDEPPQTCAWTDINPRIAASRAGDPAIPTLVTTTTDELAQHGITGVDLVVPVINHMEDRPGTAYAGSQRSKYGPTIWWYQSCMSFGCSGVGPGYDYTNGSGWPTYAIDSDATRNRAMEWMSYSYDVSGELYYEMTMAYFSGDPWTNQYNFGGTGDGTLFYPGTTAKIGGQTEIPVESLRMKMIRDGLEDHELLALAGRLGLADQAKQISRAVYPVTYQSTATPAALDSARSQLSRLILHALGKDVLPPPPPPAPDAGPAADAGGGDADAGAPAADAGQGGGAAGPGADAGSAAARPPALSSAGGGGGCASSGTQAAWVPVLALLALIAFRRRRQA
ncbi:MAG TPA: glycoside hydrolase domain-containing protein [Myxococcales bacterium]|nr:glycoside hydrolase domain-containing protein [Myxococcales bacterium]